jgi:pimeloyl-ACP methyl ester carboxylesterase
MADDGSSKLRDLHFVLVHGAGHGAWCWFKIRTILESAGFKVTCLDLKSAGMDLTDAKMVLNFEEYNEPLTQLLSNLTHNEKVILVGHSAGGLSLTHAIYNFADKIQMAIYVVADMSKHDGDMSQGLPDLYRYGDISELEYALGPDHPPTSNKIKKESLRENFYHMSPLEDSTLASMLLRAVPMRALNDVKLSPGPNSDDVPRVYIKTEYDRRFSTQQQDDLITRWPPSLNFTVKSEHSPFFSAPFQLFGFIVEAVESIIINRKTL